MWSPVAGCDLLCFDKRFIRVEVKTTAGCEARRPAVYRWGTCRGSKIKTRVNTDFCDVIALVALDVRRVIFRATKTIAGINTRLPANLFDENCEKTTWDEATFIK